MADQSFELDGPTCSYLIRLWTRRSLTDGLDDDSAKWIFRTFCVGKKGN